MRYLIVGLVLVAVGGCDFIGGGETIVRGSNNLIIDESGLEAVADALAGFAHIPEISDDELATIFGMIRSRAVEGDMDAARVILRLAAIQRMPEPEE